MDAGDILIDAYGRIGRIVHRTVGGLGAEELDFRPDPDANSIAWLVWHLARVQDLHVSEIANRDQVWTSAGWFDRFQLGLEAGDTGYRHTAAQVAMVKVEPALLLGYYDAVAARTMEYLEGVDAAELDRIIDDSYDPPVSVGVRLVSTLSDDLQHAGQAAYLRGMVERR